MIRFFIFGSIALIVLCPEAVRTQTVIQPRYTFDQGGGKGAGGALTVRQSIGQPFVQKGAGTDHALAGGFLAPAAGSGASLVVTALTVSGGWNMISLPLNSPDPRKSALFPTAISNAFMFTTMYVSQETLKAGVGYWVKFRGAEEVGMSGYLRPNDTIAVHQGWNLIGTVSGALTPASVGSVPGGLVVSNFFAFEGLYVVTDSLRPGKGYWVKASADGVLILSSSPVPVPAVNRVRVVPDEELPPEPPVSPDAGGGGELPGAFVLHQNYPNPFNPVTVIRFDLPENTHVLLRLYNILGEEVATLIDAEQEAGFRSVRLDASGLPSGVYFYRLRAGSFSSVRKLMIMK